MTAPIFEKNTKIPVVGLTGGIGAGKSFVASIFMNMGIPVYNSDLRAKAIMTENQSIKNSLIEKFGIEVYINGELNRKLIADQIFQNKDLIQWINNLVHPAVAADFENWLLLQNAPFVLKETAILIESGAYKQCDKIVVVTAPEELRIKRVAVRDNMTPLEVKNRIKNQLTEKERLKMADFIILNDGTVVVSVEIKKIISELSTINKD